MQTRLIKPKLHAIVKVATATSMPFSFLKRRFSSLIKFFYFIFYFFITCASEELVGIARMSLAMYLYFFPFLSFFVGVGVPFYIKVVLNCGGKRNS